MKISGNLKALVKKVKGEEEMYTISIYGEEREGEERAFTMNLNLNNISRHELKKLAKKLRIEDIEQATRMSFPVSVDISVPQTKLDEVVKW